MKFTYWNPHTLEEEEITMTLEDAIRNPSGIKLEDLGLALLNKERLKLGLTLFQKNLETGTFDEEVK